MKKRTLPLMLALVLMLSLCAPLAVHSEEAPLKHYGDVRLTLLFCWNGGRVMPDDPYNNDVAKAIREKIGVTVEMEGIMMSETEKLNMMFASGDMPDMIDLPFWGGNTGESGVVKKAANEGMLLALDDLIDNFPNLRNAWDVGVVSQKFLEADLQDPLMNGKKYVLPNETPGGVEDINHWAYGVFARQDVVEALGLDPASINTSEALYDFFVAVKNGGFKDLNGNDVIPLSTFHNSWSLDQVQIGFDDHPFFTNYRYADDGSITHYFFTESYMNKIYYIRKLVAEGLLDKECFTINDSVAEQRTANGTCVTQVAQYGTVLDAMKKLGTYQSNPEIKFIPLGPLYYGNGELTKVQAEMNGRNGSHGLVFPITNKNLEASLAFLDYINSKEGVILTKYGFEGDTFYFNEDGQPRWTPEMVAGRLSGDEGWRRAMWNRGIQRYDVPLIADMRKAWFGERSPGDADGEDPDIKAYKLISPIKLYDGYPINALQGKFGRQDDFNALMAGEREKVARESAYFASSDEEALKIIEEYRDYLRTGEGGVLMELLQFINDELPTRSDWLL